MVTKERKPDWQRTFNLWSGITKSGIATGLIYGFAQYATGKPVDGNDMLVAGSMGAVGAYTMSFTFGYKVHEKDPRIGSKAPDTSLQNEPPTPDIKA